MKEYTKEEKIEMFDKELNYIKNDRYKESAKVLVSLLPDYFFSVAASSTGKYHPSFSLNEGGLLRHTKSAVRIAVEMYNDESITGGYTNNEKDLMIIALMLHDGLKHGIPMGKYTCFDHAILAANFVEDNKDKTEFNDKEINFLTGVMKCHMGPWNTNSYSDVVLPKPITSHQRFVHMCDYLSSRKFLDIKFDENNNIID